MMSRSCAALFSALLMAGAAGSAVAQQYPAKAITIVTGYAAGAASDTLARMLAEALQAQWGQPVVVDNRPGSGSNIAAAYVARSAPDGYTLMVATDATLTSNTFLYKSMPFDPVKDFAPILNAAANIIVLAVHPDQPEDNSRIHRAGEAKSRKSLFRLGRRRIAASSRRRTPDAEGGHQARPCSLQGRWPGRE